MRGKRAITTRQKKDLISLFDRANAHLEQWQTADAIQTKRISILRKEWKNLRTKINLYIDNSIAYTIIFIRIWEKCHYFRYS